MCAVDTDGGFASNIGKPLESILIAPSYTITFYNKTLTAPLEKTNMSSQVDDFVFDEKLSNGPSSSSTSSDDNVKYGRVLHYTISDSITGKTVSDLTYAPFINSSSQGGGVITYETLPLAEVINPRFVEVEPSVYLMYFFSNFSTNKLPDSEYTSDPKYLRRIIEFASNEIDEVYGNASTEPYPLPNNLNYADPDLSKDSTPRIAFLSSLVRLFPAISNGALRSMLIFEKPRVLMWVGHRFGMDSHPPILVNTTQKIEWAENKELSDDLDQEAVDADPIRQVPYHHVIDGIESIMYPSYGGINFKTKPIHDVYDKVLDHVFQIEGDYSKTFKFEGNNSMRSLGVIQKDIQDLSFDSFSCEGIQGEIQTPSSISSSGFAPARKHFAVFQINMDNPYTAMTSSSASEINSSFVIQVPGALDPRLDDKPEFWSYYWDECGAGASASSSSSGPTGIGGEIIIDGVYGEGCVNGITLWAKIEAKPYAYINGVKDRLWLTIGLKTSFNVDLDILWQGYYLSTVNEINGEYKRFWGMGDDCPDIITVDINTDS
jgi:hypothetical protein